LAFLSGILSTLSPCVLPLLPAVLGAAASEHRAGPVALRGGRCPTLGAASLLAAQRTDPAQVAATTFVFGLGAAAPLLLLGVLSRGVLVRRRECLLATSSVFKAGLGLLLMLIGIAILKGIDKQIETDLVEASPQWLTNLTTRF